MCQEALSVLDLERERLRTLDRAPDAHDRRLVSTSPYGIFVLDRQAHFREVNLALANIVGRSADEIIGKHLREIVAPDDIERTLARHADRMAGEERKVEHVVSLMHASGERRLVHVRAATIEEDGSVTGTHGIVRDITEERARERQLRRAERLASVGTLVGGVAHELNNPLHAIRNVAELMLFEQRPSEDEELLQMILREADRAARVVADLRRLARETQESTTGREPSDVNEILRHCLRVRRYSLETANIAIEEDLAPDLPPVLANRCDLEQVVFNLLINAEQALKERATTPKLLLRTRRTAGWIALSIIDNGPGISPDHIERIYDPFFTTKSPGEGTGLGLSLVHNIIAEHGGEIDVESQQGKGTAFRIELPVAATIMNKIEPSEPSSNSSGSLRILVVDDEPAIRRVTCRYLDRIGHQVDEASDGGQALLLIGESDYDVIISDLRMPGIGGEELHERLRTQAPGMEKRLIFVTGDVVGGRGPNLEAKLHVPVLTKPLRLAELRDAVEQLVG